jgi:hypothetical protein
MARAKLSSLSGYVYQNRVELSSVGVEVENFQLGNINGKL